MTLSSKTLSENLKSIFGFNKFRANQEEIIQNLLDGNNSMVIIEKKSKINVKVSNNQVKKNNIKVNNNKRAINYIEKYYDDKNISSCSKFNQFINTII